MCTNPHSPTQVSQSTDMLHPFYSTNVLKVNNHWFSLKNCLHKGFLAVWAQKIFGAVVGLSQSFQVDGFIVVQSRRLILPSFSKESEELTSRVAGQDHEVGVYFCWHQATFDNPVLLFRVNCQVAIFINKLHCYGKKLWALSSSGLIMLWLPACIF